ncbi:helix-turn-helix domain-containing protein [Streptococcus sp. OBRC6]|uniref:helix-turn-helix domain-containing protein n=1 Tax=Streptococcus sp. OBRC6 TaxID=936587 RepID=UPI002FBDC813
MKKARLKSGLTQKQVAERLGVAQAQYARWESGGKNPKDKTIAKLAEIFGVGLDYLKGRDDGLEDIVDLLRKVELTDGQKLEIYFLIKKYLKM